MLFVGIDLAWSERNSSGIAIIDGNGKAGTLRYANTLLSDNEILDFVSENVKEKDALIAIDAPLIVPNPTGRRIAEEQVGNLFRRYDAGAHPANRTRLSSWSGTIRGEELVKSLSELGFLHDPYVKKLENSRKMFEVYPHPSMVVLFNLNRILQYKAKPNRSLEFRISEFKKYQQGFKLLKNPSLKVGNDILEKDLRKLKLTELKSYEDTLDAVFCAYIAHYYWVNPQLCSVLGNMEKGYIVTPVFKRMLMKQTALKN